MKAYLEIEMPTSCCECAIKSWDGEDDVCPFSGISALSIGRQDDCPLIPVPPHGRLIDADKQDAQIEALIERHLHGYTKSTWDFVCELRDILKRNPTIIPAEPGEEETCTKN